MKSRCGVRSVVGPTVGLIRGSANFSGQRKPFHDSLGGPPSYRTFYPQRAETIYLKSVNLQHLQLIESWDDVFVIDAAIHFFS
jgi:hypothetical protein